MDKRLTLLCDQDGILADCIGHWLKKIEERYGVKASYTDITQWSPHKAAPYVGKVTADQVYGLLREPGFFLDMPPLPGAIEALKLLNDRFNVFVVTGPSGPQSIMDKFAWLAKHAPFIKEEQIITCNVKHKTLIKADVIIDDNPDILVQYPQVWPGAMSVGIEYPYNNTVGKGVFKSDFSVVYDGYPNTQKAWSDILGHIYTFAAGL